MRPLSLEQIACYVATGEPLEKAGAFAIQERGAMLIEKVEGDFYTVVGLPLCDLTRALGAFGIDTLSSTQ
jgi:septum formation protein